MRTTFDILDVLYPLLNVSAVWSTLDTGGKVYRNARPVDSNVRDVVVLALPIVGGTDIDVQGCTAIINCHAKDLAPGRPDDTNLDAMTAAVVAAIEGYTISTSYHHLEITSQSSMADMDRPGWSYASIRVDCTIQFIP